MATQQDHHVARRHGPGGEACGQRDGRAPQLVIGDPPVVEDQRHLGGLRLGAGGEVRPEVARPPVALRVEALASGWKLSVDMGSSVSVSRLLIVLGRRRGVTRRETE